MASRPEKVQLLRQLSLGSENHGTIERTADDRPQGERSRTALLFGACALAILIAGVGIAAGMWLSGETAIEQGMQAQQSASGAPVPSSGSSAADEFTASGYIVARRIATVSAQVTGRLTDVLIEEGSTVQRGQLLARLDPAGAQVDLASADASLARSFAAEQRIEAQLAGAEARLSRAQALQSRGFVSDANLEAIEQEEAAMRASLREARAQSRIARLDIDRQRVTYDRFEVRAPFGGVVIDTSAQPGEIVSPLSTGGFTRTGICTIVDMNSLEVEVDVNEANIGRVVAGAPVGVSLEAYPGVAFNGRVIAIVPTANRDRATVRVRVGLDNPDPRILPDMAARVVFRSAKARPAP